MNRSSRSLRNGFRRWGLCAAALACSLTAVAARGVEIPTIDHPMFADPDCRPPVARPIFPEGIRELWRQALARTDTELRRSAADAVVQARRQGMTDLDDLRGELAKMLATPGQDRGVRRAAAHALVSLDARDQSRLLAEAAAADGLEVARFVEPALARWGYPAMHAPWRDRLRDTQAGLLRRLLAAECLAAADDSAAIPLLRTTLRDAHEPANLRLAAAEALGRLSDKGLVEEARQLVADKSRGAVVERILGVTILRRQSEPAAIDLLRELTGDEEPTVAAAAFEQLLDRDPRHAFDLAGKAVAHRDANVRRAGARALAAKADAESVGLLRPLLTDSNPELRRWVAQALVNLAERDGLRPEVQKAIEATLAGDAWQGLEQAALMAVALEHHPVARRLVELMPHPRPEVAHTACFALRRFRLPDMLPAMLDHAQRQHERQFQPEVLGTYREQMINEQHTQLFQAFGEVRYQAAEPLMRKFVGKNLLIRVQSRAAACWALGHLHADDPNEDLSGQFEARILDVSSKTPEVPEVRRMCAVSLGRMKSTATLPTLQNFAKLEGLATDVGIACWWAIEQMSAGTRPAAVTPERRILGWFLQPIQKF